MIFIKRNTTNKVVLTLNELITISPYDVLFKFSNETTGEIKLFTATDISPATERYNEFSIVENVTENLYNGIVSLDPVGYWSYIIYEMAPSSPVSLDPTNAISILEIGKVLVDDNIILVTPTFDTNEDKNNVVFE